MNTKLMIEVERSTSVALTHLAVEAIQQVGHDLNAVAQRLDERTSSMLQVVVEGSRLEIRYVGSEDPVDRVLVIREVEQ